MKLYLESNFVDVVLFRKGISASVLPYKRTPPSWLKTTSTEVIDHICKLAKKGLFPSQIGVILRDSHGIAQVKAVTGRTMVAILRANGTVLEVRHGFPAGTYLFIL